MHRPEELQWKWNSALASVGTLPFSDQSNHCRNELVRLYLPSLWFPPFCILITFLEQRNNNNTMLVRFVRAIYHRDAGSRVGREKSQRTAARTAKRKNKDSASRGSSREKITILIFLFYFPQRTRVNENSIPHNKLEQDRQWLRQRIMRTWCKSVAAFQRRWLSLRFFLSVHSTAWSTYSNSFYSNDTDRITTPFHAFPCTI